jgi:hypothetical protein
MKIENVEVSGFKNAFHGMRNPMNSWDKSDSIWNASGDHIIGYADNELAKKLIKAGSEHRKFLRMIHIQCFITIPRYIWQEMDTYKVSTVRISCSTMHKLGMTDLTEDDFQDKKVLPHTLHLLNSIGSDYRKTKDVELLRAMKQILPEGFLQSADLDFNYETAMNMYHQRKNHRMSEWSGENGICKWIESLPMMKEWLYENKRMV